MHMLLAQGHLFLHRGFGDMGKHAETAMVKYWAKVPGLPPQRRVG